MDNKKVRVGNTVAFKRFKNNPVNEGQIEVQLTALDIKQMGSQDFEGIELTEEILMKIGFVGGNKCYHHPSTMLFTLFNVSVLTGGFKLIAGRNCNGSILQVSVQIKYVHELQNLFFALTGEELKTQ